MKYILSFDIAKGNSVYCLIDQNKNVCFIEQGMTQSINSLYMFKSLV